MRGYEAETSIIKKAWRIINVSYWQKLWYNYCYTLPQWRRFLGRRSSTQYTLQCGNWRNLLSQFLKSSRKQLLTKELISQNIISVRVISHISTHLRMHQYYLVSSWLLLIFSYTFNWRNFFHFWKAHFETIFFSACKCLSLATHKRPLPENDMGERRKNVLLSNTFSVANFNCFLVKWIISTW